MEKQHNLHTHEVKPSVPLFSYARGLFVNEKTKEEQAKLDMKFSKEVKARDPVDDSLLFFGLMANRDY